MNELITDLKSLELETLKNLKNSKSKNTLRAYQADFKDFSAFCIKIMTFHLMNHAYGCYSAL